MNDDSIIHFNVGGEQLETTLSTIKKGDWPLTKLLSGNWKEKDEIIYINEKYYMKFIDRNGLVFRAIIDYLRTDSDLVYSRYIPEDVVIKELETWGIVIEKPRCDNIGDQIFNENIVGISMSLDWFIDRYLNPLHNTIKGIIKDGMQHSICVGLPPVFPELKELINHIRNYYNHFNKSVWFREYIDQVILLKTLPSYIKIREKIEYELLLIGSESRKLVGNNELSERDKSIKENKYYSLIRQRKRKLENMDKEMVGEKYDLMKNKYENVKVDYVELFSNEYIRNLLKEKFEKKGLFITIFKKGSEKSRGLVNFPWNNNEHVNDCWFITITWAPPIVKGRKRKK